MVAFQRYRFRLRTRPFVGVLAFLLLLGVGLAGCGSESSDAASEEAGGGGGERGSRGGPGGRGGPPGGGGPESAAVPVEVEAVERSRIAATLTTHGTLEAEKEVDLVARTAGPIVDLRVEEGMTVTRGQLLARIDPREASAQLEISRVQLAEAEADFERTRSLRESNLVSLQVFEDAQSALERARAEHARNDIQLAYTEIRAPFAGLIVRRYIKDAETVANNQALFRISDFDPLLCYIRVPERELPRLSAGQRALLQVEAYGERRFEARVERISPVVDSESGTVKVTLQADPQGQLRPGMFASVALEVDARENALVVPRAALSLDSIGDSVFVVVDGAAQRREIGIGYREGERIEVVSGLAEGEFVVVLGQDGLADGTPVQRLDARAAASRPPEASHGPPPGRDPGGQAMDPERLDQIKERMRARGLSEAEIEERLERFRQGGFPDPPGRTAEGAVRENPGDNRGN